MTAFQALVTAILQGVTELFPVSSLGHAVILPAILGWQIDQQSPSFLPFLVILHLGTATALLVYFWRDWIQLLLAVLGRPTERLRADELRLLGLIIIATIPAAIVGFALNKFLRGLFGVPTVAAIFLIVGVTMVGGLLAGLHHKEAARFSFLIATPIIIGASVLEVPKLLHHDAAGGSGFTGLAVVAGIVAGITAYLSIAFLMHYFKKHDFDALDPFAWYCWAAGAASLALLYFVI